MNFARSVNTLRTAGISCTTTWIPTSTVSNWNSGLCLGDVYEAITAYNACANNGLNIQTGQTSTRCDYEDYVSIERDYRPWPKMLTLAMSNTPVIEFAGKIATSFSNKLDTMNCRTCYYAIYTTMKTVLGSGANPVCANGAIFSDACRGAFLSNLEIFSQCTGGLQMQTSKPISCTSDEIDIVETIYRPYQSLVACAVFGDPSRVDRFQTCMRQYNGFVDIPRVTCGACYDQFVSEVQATDSFTCKSNPMANTCIADLSGYRGALMNFQICSGFAMNTQTSTCTVSEQQPIGTEFNSYLSLVVATVGATGLQSAADIITQNPTLASLATTTAIINCRRCYRAFMLDVWVLFSNSGFARTACAHLQSTICKTLVLGQILARFETCAGYPLHSDSMNECSATDARSVLLATAVTATALSQVNSTGFLSLFPVMYQNLNRTVTVNDTCLGCYRYFGMSLADLTHDQKTTCNGLNNPVCFELIASPLANYKSCSGYSFPVTQTAAFLPTFMNVSNISNTTNTTETKYSGISQFYLPLIAAIMISILY
jgi:hypothetical protein